MLCEIKSVTQQEKKNIYIYIYIYKKKKRKEKATQLQHSAQSLIVFGAGKKKIETIRS